MQAKHGGGYNYVEDNPSLEELTIAVLTDKRCGLLHILACRIELEYTIQGFKREAVNVHHGILRNHFNDKYVGYVDVQRL